MFESERKYCRRGLSQSITTGDLEAAQDWLSALQEFQPDTYGEQTVLDRVIANAELNDEISNGMCPGSDPVDGLEGGQA